jgi:hypothetical protein
MFHSLSLHSVLKRAAILLSACLGPLSPNAMEVPRTAVIIHIGGNALNMKPFKDTSINAFRVSYPGFYAKVAGESYYNATDFVHFDLGMSLNRAAMEHGYARISRLVMNYGFGKTLERVKFTLSPGLCYSQMAYQNEANNRTMTETRFSPSLALQTDLILYKSQYNYLGIFAEGSIMIAEPKRCVHQLAIGLSWKPSFRKNDVDPVAP